MLDNASRDEAIFALIGHANEGMAKAAQIKEADYRRSQEVEAVLPEVLDTLVLNRRIAPELRVKAAAQLRDHVTALEFIKELANRDAAQAAGSLGSGYKQATLQGGSTHQQRIADIEERFYQGMGL